MGAQLRAKALRRRAPRALLRKITSYASSPPCNTVSSMGWKLFVDVIRCLRCHLQEDPMFAKGAQSKKGSFPKTDYHLLSLCWSDWMYQVSFARKPNFCKNLNIKSDSLRKRRDDLFTFFLTCSNASGVFCKKAQLWQKCQTCTEGINRKRALSQKSRDHLLRLWWRDWICGVSFAKGPNICKGAQ